MGDLSKKLGDRVRQLRALRGLTQAALAERASISLEWVRRIERGTTSPSSETIEALARALDVEITAPLGLPTDAAVDARLVVAIRGFDPAEQEWLLGLIDQIAERPKRT